MCDIDKKTRLKTVSVYKVCLEFKDVYYGYFSHMEIKGRYDEEDE